MVPRLIQVCRLPRLRSFLFPARRVVACIVAVALLVPVVLAQSMGPQLASPQQGTSGAAAGQTGNGSFGAQFNYGTAAPNSPNLGALFSLLQQHPELLAAAKMRIAQTLGIDPTTIPDQAIYDRISQDPAIQAKILGDLQKLGYSLPVGLTASMGGATPPGGLSSGSSFAPFAGNLSQLSNQTQFPAANGNAVCPPGYVAVPAYSASSAYSQSPYGNQPAYSTQPTYGTQPGYGAPAAAGTQPAYLPQPGYGQQPGYAPAYGQSSYGAPSAYGSQPLTGPQMPNNTQMPTAQSPYAGTQTNTGVNGVVCQPFNAVQNPQQIQLPQPTILQRTTPYANLPSLQDLYAQMLPPDTNLRRFGSDMFLLGLGTGNADILPMDLPAGPDYVLGPGDALNVNMWGSQANTLSVVIDRQGQLALPEAGTANVSGLTIAEAQTAIQKTLHTQYKDMHVELSLGRVRTVRVYVVGDVQRPGAYDISSLSTPLNALYAAGGPTAVGSLRTLRHYRGKQLVSELDLYDFLLRGVRSGVERLLPGDTILVPPVGPLVTVTGMVRRPAIYELNGTDDLKDVLELAGGPMASATLQEISVERVDAHQRRTMLSVRLGDRSPSPTQDASASAAVPSKTPVSLRVTHNAEEEPGNATAPDSASLPEEREVMLQLATFHVQDEDHVIVRPILPYNEGAVYLDGHVFRPGKYAYREGMTINDLLHSYQDVMPEPAEHIELIRLKPPDYHPATTLLNLPDVLSGNHPVLLQPLDVVRVFSRYEVDPPTVTIQGDVIRPGDYPMAAGMTAAALLKMAGGFRRGAYQDIADLSTYTVQDGKKLLLQASTVDIGKAMRGDRNADILLRPGDVLSIREITGWQDVGSTVTVSGEVGHAGTYGIAPGERLSSILKRAGGFREGAYPAGAELDRISVRQQEESTRQDLINRLQSQDLGSMMAASSADSSVSASEQGAVLQMMQQQRQSALRALQNNPAKGRLVLRITPDIAQWENTAADVELRAGDTLTVPKEPGFVVISGQVYNPSALSYSPGKNAAWYLTRAGGPTRFGNKKDIYVLRADGSVVSRRGRFSEAVLAARLKPGDSIIVPEKIVGPSLWRYIIGTAQSFSNTAMTSVVAAGL
jgi:protein involved in polysaccharide export with SLBB domain